MDFVLFSAPVLMHFLLFLPLPNEGFATKAEQLHRINVSLAQKCLRLRFWSGSALVGEEVEGFSVAAPEDQLGSQRPAWLLRGNPRSRAPPPQRRPQVSPTMSMILPLGSGMSSSSCFSCSLLLRGRRRGTKEKEGESYTRLTKSVETTSKQDCCLLPKVHCRSL